MIDSWTVDGRGTGHTGWSFRVELAHDTDVRPESDGGWATAEHVAAWKRDEWLYVVAEVTPVDDRGRAWEGDSQVMGAVAWGTLDSETDIGRVEFERDTLPDMIAECMKSVGAETPGS